MGGYIGARSGTLSTTAANVQDVTATDTTPEVTIINNTHEDTDGGREGKVIFKGQQSGGEESTLAEIQGSHDGTADDEKGDLIFRTNDGSDGSSPTTAMTIDSGQNLLVGTASSFGTSGITLGANNVLYSAAAGQNVANFQRYTSDGELVRFGREGTTVGSISVTSSATAFNTSSDYRLKENVTDITDGITRVKQLSPKRFNFIVDADTTVDGFLAHEAQAVVPEAVHGTKDEVDDNGNAVMQGIDQSKLVPLLTAALQEAIAKIETLETQNTTQATQIADLITRVAALEAA